MTTENQKIKKTKPSRSLLEQEKAREAYKLNLWNHRVALIKKGNLLVKNNLFGEAVIVYEKYLKILELIYDCGPNGLTPEMLKESARTTELSVIAGIYWDLLRIYDSNDAYLNRQKQVAEKLAKFSIFTPLFTDLMNKARIFQKKSRHPEIIKTFISNADKGRARCFIATAAFNSASTQEVLILRNFRDSKLKNNYYGRRFVLYYYKFSPGIACFIDKHEYLKSPIRGVLRLVIKCVT